MNQTWAKRIQRLESILQSRALPPVVFRYGSVKRLPIDPPSERHVGISRSESTGRPGVERCEFEERVGPAPPPYGLVFHVYINLEDGPENTS